MANAAADSHLAEVRAQAQRIAELEAGQRELAVLRRDMAAVQAERDDYADQAGRARDQVVRLEAKRDQLRADLSSERITTGELWRRIRNAQKVAAAMHPAGCPQEGENPTDCSGCAVERALDGGEPGG